MMVILEGRIIIEVCITLSELVYDLSRAKDHNYVKYNKIDRIFKKFEGKVVLGHFAAYKLMKKI
jgi:hypothetical protein